MIKKEQCPQRLADALDDYMRTEFGIPFTGIPQMFRNRDGDRVMLVRMDGGSAVTAVMEDYPGHLVPFRLELNRGGTIETI